MFKFNNIILRTFVVFYVSLEIILRKLGMSLTKITKLFYKIRKSKK